MYFRNIADQFGRGVGTCWSATNDVIDAICQLRSRFIKWPRGDDLRDIINGFDALSKCPMVGGSIDGSHIPVLAPADQRNDYYCYKGYYSIILQGIVDYRGRFINAFTGFPGRANDARVFSASSVYRAGTDGQLFDNFQAIIEGVVVKPLLVGDSAYPLRPWLMKCYSYDDRLTASQAEFNLCLNTARNVVERAFGILKARFRCLGKQIDMSVLNAPDLILACCCLHNFCIDNKEVVLQQWEDEAILDEQELGRRARAARDDERAQHFTLYDDLPGADIDNDAEIVRNAIKTYLANRQGE